MLLCAQLCSSGSICFSLCKKISAFECACHKRQVSADVSKYVTLFTTARMQGIKGNKTVSSFIVQETVIP
jgi:hypothetical protein